MVVVQRVRVCGPLVFYEVIAMNRARLGLLGFTPLSPPHPISEILARFFVFPTPTIEILLLHQY